MSDSCEPVGGGDLPQQLSLHPRALKAVFPQYLLYLKHWGGNQRHLQSVIGHLGAADSHMVDVDCCDRAWVLVGIQSWASGKIFVSSPSGVLVTVGHFSRGRMGLCSFICLVRLEEQSVATEWDKGCDTAPPNLLFR